MACGHFRIVLLRKRARVPMFAIKCQQLSPSWFSGHAATHSFRLAPCSIVHHHATLICQNGRSTVEKRNRRVCPRGIRPGPAWYVASLRSTVTVGACHRSGSGRYVSLKLLRTNRTHSHPAHFGSLRLDVDNPSWKAISLSWNDRVRGVRVAWKRSAEHERLPRDTGSPFRLSLVYRN